jgi:hypothetical protein
MTIVIDGPTNVCITLGNFVPSVEYTGLKLPDLAKWLSIEEVLVMKRH